MFGWVASVLKSSTTRIGTNTAKMDQRSIATSDSYTESYQAFTKPRLTSTTTNRRILVCAVCPNRITVYASSLGYCTEVSLAVSVYSMAKTFPTLKNSRAS